jgi:teichuronic acid biosynthesis glycosyltransferase TuaH
MSVETNNQVVFISHTHAGGIFRVGSHHLARELSIRGYDVAHVSTPFSTAHAALGKGADGRKQQSRLGAQRDEHGGPSFLPDFRPRAISRTCCGTRVSSGLDSCSLISR